MFYVIGPTQVAGDYHTKKFCFVDDFQGVTFWEVELGKKFKLFAKVEYHNFAFLGVNLHSVLFSECTKVGELVLKCRLMRREDKAARDS